MGIMKTCESVILPVLCKPSLTLSATNIAKTEWERDRTSLQKKGAETETAGFYCG